MRLDARDAAEDAEEGKGTQSDEERMYRGSAYFVDAERHKRGF